MFRRTRTGNWCAAAIATTAAAAVAAVVDAALSKENRHSRFQTKPSSMVAKARATAPAGSLGSVAELKLLE